jgi:hypothetical protein
MELADQSQIAALLASSAIEVQRNQPRMSRKTSRAPAGREPRAHNARQRRCRCGTCAACRDNARWERIFQSKFADPDYYVRRAIRHESPLNSL